MHPESIVRLKAEIAAQLASDVSVLDQLRREISPLRTAVHPIRARTTTAISLVGTDGGNNRIQFDPFLVQLVRVVDSSDNELCLDAVTPTTDVLALSRRQFDAEGRPTTPIGEMMSLLGCPDLTRLSPMIRRNDGGRPVSSSWVQVYRELVEWATLLSLVRNRNYGTDTLIVFDGLLRSKVFAGDLFHRYITHFGEAIRSVRERDRRNIYLVGLAKHSKVLDRYRLAMTLERVLNVEFPAYLEVPREIEEKAYVWSEYARGNDVAGEDGEINKFVGGKMFFAKFGSSPHDPVWPVDLFTEQARLAPTVMGYLLADAESGFPVPFYPRCLQRAHENAALVDFDFDVMQDHILDGIRAMLGSNDRALDVMRLQASDPAQNRYG